VKYMFLLFNEEPANPPEPEALAAEMPQWIQFGEDAAKVATQVAGEALQPSPTATVVSIRNGKTITTDGPFVETKEQIGGFYVLDCANLDVALGLAAKIPWAPTGHIEVRPVMEFE
jgi:hypothetical protein